MSSDPSWITLGYILPTWMQVLLPDWLIVCLIACPADWATPFVVHLVDLAVDAPLFLIFTGFWLIKLVICEFHVLLFCFSAAAVFRWRAFIALRCSSPEGTEEFGQNCEVFYPNLLLLMEIKFQWITDLLSAVLAITAHCSLWLSSFCLYQTNCLWCCQTHNTHHFSEYQLVFSLKKKTPNFFIV